MKVAIIGSGGREHAILKSVLKSGAKCFVIPGNGGMSDEAVLVDIDIKNIDAVVEFCKREGMDFVIVAPDDPLAAGMVDALEHAGIRCFGPSRAAARIESSKVFSKELMKKYKIPTAKYEVFDDVNKALSYVETAPIPTVIKADGLALGKGVIIAATRQEAIDGVKRMMEEKKFGESGARIVIEEFLEGPEVSVLAFTDGKTLKPMVSSMDHKRAFDGDHGPNTGGMGTVAPNPFYTKEIEDRCMKEIFLPTVDAMNRENAKFKGCLYFGLMLTKDGPKVIEYNCRFGDPETQVVLPLLETDLMRILTAVADETLDAIDIVWKEAHACCVVLASGGYPETYRTGYEIQGIDGEALVFAAGVKKVGDRLLTAGGRVLGVTGIGVTLEEAVAQAYLDADRIHFQDMHRREDIGARALSLSK